MSNAAQQLAKARAARDEARAEYDASLAQLRGDPAQQTIGERVADRLKRDARGALQHSLDVASESKGIIAGTVAALALWFLRHPIIAWAEQMFGEQILGNQAEESDEND